MDQELEAKVIETTKRRIRKKMQRKQGSRPRVRVEGYAYTARDEVLAFEESDADDGEKGADKVVAVNIREMEADREVAADGQRNIALEDEAEGE
jgi:hypothetical protein